MGFANGYRYGQLSAADRVRYMDEFAASGAKWFRMNLENWSLAEAQDVVAKARERGFCVVGNLNANPSGTHWANPPDHKKWADAAVSTFVKPLINDVTVWEIWNEPNIGDFFNGTSDDYADLLHTAYVAITPPSRGRWSRPPGSHRRAMAPTRTAPCRTGPVCTGGTPARGARAAPACSTCWRTTPTYPRIPRTMRTTRIGAASTRQAHPPPHGVEGDGDRRCGEPETGAPSGCTFTQCITVEEAARRVTGVMNRWTVEWGAFTGPLMWHELQEQPGVTDIEHYFGFMRGDWSHKEPLWTAYKNYAAT
jgi:hypothetical protein